MMMEAINSISKHTKNATHVLKQKNAKNSFLPTSGLPGYKLD